jgi:Rad51
MAQLHYLYDQAGDGKEHFVYYCSTCTCVIQIRKDLGPAKIAGPVGERCAGCGRTLAGSVECMYAPVPKDWSDVLVTVSPQLPRPEPLFQSAASIPHFSLNFSRLDSLLRPLSEGHLIVVSGQTSQVVAELAAFRAQLPIKSGGLDSVVLFVDGGNRSDPYLFSSFAKQRGLKPAVAMRRVTSCRVFTFYQLAALISEHLVRAVADYGTRLVVISDALGTFNEPELDEREARRVLSAIEEGIEKVKKHALVIVTLASPNKYDDMVASWADAVVHLSSVGDGVRAELLRHRNRLPGETAFRLSQLLRAAKNGGHG